MLIAQLLFVGLVFDHAVRFLRTRSVRGSQRRFVLASVGRCSVWLGYANWVWWSVLYLHYGAYPMIAVNAVGFCVQAWAHQRDRSEDDDDWFKKAGKRLRRRLRSIAAGSMTSAPAAGTA